MSNIETMGRVVVEMPHDRDYIAKRSELLVHGKQYVNRSEMWPREFVDDMQEIGYRLEHTEAISLLQDIVNDPYLTIKARNEIFEEQSNKRTISLAWAASAPWNQEEGI